jgi:hypothetical protein
VQRLKKYSQTAHDLSFPTDLPSGVLFFFAKSGRLDPRSLRSRLFSYSHIQSDLWRPNR